MEPSGTTCAGIVVFHPEPAELARLVAAVAPDVREVVVFANSDVPPAEEEALRAAAAPTTFSVLRPGGNVGLGAAYNALAGHADRHGDAFLFVLDQDSLPAPGTVPALAAAHRGLAESGERSAIVGPRPVGPDGAPMRIAPRAEVAPRAGMTRVSFVISSGSLLDVTAVSTVGPFRDDYFIDAIDLEWCFRAGAAGRSIWIADAIRMDHRLGRGVIRLPVLGLLLADQPPRRLYTFIRNQIAMLRLSHVPLAHKTKTLLSLPARLVIYLVRNGFSGDCRRALLNGLRDGVANRLGPPDHALTSRRSR